MRTRAKSGFHLPTQHLNLLTTPSLSISPLPKTYKTALLDPNWATAMREEFSALLQNDTWKLVPRPPGANIIFGNWIFRQKFHSDGSLSRYKARWVCRCFSQQHGIDYDETFSPVVKSITIRTVLSIAVSSEWPIHQVDVKNAFLHGSLQETVYCQQPLGFEDASAPDHVCLLHKSLYGLKQAPRAWFQCFSTYIQTIGFTPSLTDTSLFSCTIPPLTLRTYTFMLMISYLQPPHLLFFIISSLSLALSSLWQILVFFIISSTSLAVTHDSHGIFLSQR
jgi:hypothetical protein